jgi:hypothetical protein
VLERIAAEHLALPRERGVGVEDAETTANHDDDGHDVYPMRGAHDPVVSLFGQYLLPTTEVLTAELLAQLAGADIEATQRSRVR